jgi:hypothetical protein
MTAGRSGIQRPDTGPGGTLRYRSSGLRLSDPELRRRHPEAELPPLHIAEEAVTSGAAHEASGSVSADQQMTLDAAAQETAGPAALGDGREPDAEEIEARTGTIGIQQAGRAHSVMTSSRPWRRPEWPKRSSLNESERLTMIPSRQRRWPLAVLQGSLAIVLPTLAAPFYEGLSCGI